MDASAVSSRVRLETMQAVQKESDGALLCEIIEEFQFPELVIKGGRNGLC